MQEAPLASLKIRVPPHNLDAEMALLGSVMLRPDAIYEIMDIVRVDSFYFDKHRIIFEAMLELFSKHQPIDLLSLSSRLKEKGLLERIGGTTFLTELSSVVPSSANIKHYADIVRKKFMMRELIEASEYISHLGFNEAGELEDILDQAEKKVFDITQHFSSTDNFKDLKPLLHESFERFEKLSSAEHELRGIPTGFKALDDILGGFQSSDLIILAARPSVGKTAFALDVARRVASAPIGAPVGVFSLEMSADQLVDRIVAAQSKVDASVIRKGVRSQTGAWRDDIFKNISTALDELSRAPIFIDDQAGNTIMRMRSAARKLKIEKGLKLLVVDYLQLMAPSGGRNDNMNQVVTEISRGLKHLARELQIPVIALSQLSRGIETRGGKPKLSDLRDSGSIEQDADLVMFIHQEEDGIRDENGKMREVQRKQLIIAKHRNGPLGEVTMDYHTRFNTFVEIDYSNYGKAEEEFKNF
jgi:replicative DNA helicase